ncbi:MAG TPA: hypothetical protein VFC63_03500 [Blastocatellia bacterium]|nr:hypothetical protein [Blastocatellia bacterium]
MIGRVFSLLRLPFLLIVIWVVARFALGLAGVPYAPRGNAMFSVLGLSLISSVYFGGLARKLAGLGWGGTILVGIFIGLFAEILILIATFVSYQAHLNTYYTHWDALNIPEGTTVPLARAMATRVGGLIAGPILCTIAALIGRILSGLLPGSAK